MFKISNHNTFTEILQVESRTNQATRAADPVGKASLMPRAKQPDIQDKTKSMLPEKRKRAWLPPGVGSSTASSDPQRKKML